jgi:hypothetical protein
MARNGRERAFACDTSSLICAGRFDTRRRAKPDLILPDPMIAMVMSELLCGAHFVGGWVSGLSGTISGRSPQTLSKGPARGFCLIRGAFGAPIVRRKNAGRFCCTARRPS